MEYFLKRSQPLLTSRNKALVFFYNDNLIIKILATPLLIRDMLKNQDVMKELQLSRSTECKM